jgi:hypothetical protein
MEDGKWIREFIENYVETNPRNVFPDGSGDRIWGTPMVGFSSGSDPLYGLFQEGIGEFFPDAAEVLCGFPQPGGERVFPAQRHQLGAARLSAYGGEEQAGKGLSLREMIETKILAKPSAGDGEGTG